MKRIVLANLRDGMITDEAGASFLSRGIAAFCGKTYNGKRVLGRSHNACVRYLAVVPGYPEGWYTQDATWPRSKYTPIADLEREMNEEGRDVRFLWPRGASEAQGRAAAKAFKVGQQYDLSPYVRAILALAGRFNPLCALVSKLVPDISAWLWCTETARDQWFAQGCDPWCGNSWADPGDTAVAVLKGLLDVRAECIVPASSDYAGASEEL